MFHCFIFQSTSQPSDMAKKVDQHLKLDEILDICADFEKQIKAEQEELKQIAQQKIEEEKNQINHQQFQHSQAKGQLILKCPFGWNQKTNKKISRISAVVSKKRSNQRNKGTLYH